MATGSSKIHPQYPLLSRVYNGVAISAVQGFSSPIRWLQGWNEYFWPTGSEPNIIKTYDTRPQLPIRIFFPKDYDQTSPENLPLIFVIHGGGFCVGLPNDDDEWNRVFSDKQRFLVIALNYRKAPWYPFPTAPQDCEALMLAVITDESLPIDKSRVAVAGFSAGGNLALSVCQLSSIRENVKPSAAIPMYPSVDQALPHVEKEKRRHYKTDLGPGLRSQATDMLASFSPIFKWSYINPGQDLTDPLLSPYYAPPGTLPPNVYVVAAELDQLSHEAWRLAKKLAGLPEPTAEDKTGQEKVSSQKGSLMLDDERFAFQKKSPTGGNIGWLLIPDQVHGYDHLPLRWYGDEASFQDARIKMEHCQQVLGDWLRKVVWKN